MSEQPLIEEHKPKRSYWLNVGILISTLALILFVFAFGYGYFQLANTTLTLARAVSSVEQKLEVYQKEVSGLRESVQRLEQGLEKTQNLSQQHEKLVGEWEAAQKGNTEKWSVAEAEYIVKVANDRLQFALDINQAKLLLKRADQVLSTVQNPNVLEIRKSLAQAIVTLESMPQADLTSIYVRMTALRAQIEKLRIPTDTLQAQPQTSVVEQEQSWWQRGFKHLWRNLKEVVVVRNVNAVPIVSPEEKLFLYQNIQAQIENAIWALLHNNATVYQTSLAHASNQITRYFVQEDAITKAVIAELQALQQINIQTNAVNLSPTLTLFENYFKQAASAPTVASPEASPGTQDTTAPAPSSSMQPTQGSIQGPTQ